MAEPAWPAGPAAKIESLRTLVRAAQGRADRAGLLADRYEVLAAHADNPHRDLHDRMARTHRGTQRRHVAVVELHARYLTELESFRSTAPRLAAPPRFVGALAERLGVADLGLALLAGGQWVAAAATTPLVRAAQDLEYTLAEGPMRDATRGAVHAGTPGAIGQRWPRYGAGLVSLGARSVQAAPISQASAVLGVLLVLDRPGAAVAAALAHLADDVALSLLLASESAGADDAASGMGAHPALDEADDWACIHQAAGIVSVQQCCTIPDALDLLRARAFADDIPTVLLAERIVRHEADLD